MKTSLALLILNGTVKTKLAIVAFLSLVEIVKNLLPIILPDSGTLMFLFVSWWKGTLTFGIFYQTEVTGTHFNRKSAIGPNLGKIYQNLPGKVNSRKLDCQFCAFMKMSNGFKRTCNLMIRSLFSVGFFGNA